MKVKTIGKSAKARLAHNKHYMWRVERIIYKTGSAAAKFNYEMSKSYAKARGQL